MHNFISNVVMRVQLRPQAVGIWVEMMGGLMPEHNHGLCFPLDKHIC